jgi:uncharacterized membrane-anchored protein YhcB (DUF1043 family)
LPGPFYGVTPDGYPLQSASVAAQICDAGFAGGRPASADWREERTAVFPFDDNTSLWVVGILSFLLGTILGCIGAYLFLGRYNQALRLQEELCELRKRFSDYRDQVSRHFMRTSELVQEMTQSYRAVYEHLASGAQELCEEELDTPSLDAPGENLLAEGGQPADGGYDEALIGDTPRISDIRIRVESEKNSPRQH